MKTSVLVSDCIWLGTKWESALSPEVSFFQQDRKGKPRLLHPLLITIGQNQVVASLAHHSWISTSTALISAEHEFETHGEYTFTPCKPSRSTEATLEAMGLLSTGYCATSLFLHLSGLHSFPTQGKEITVPEIAIGYNPFVFYKSGIIIATQYC